MPLTPEKEALLAKLNAEAARAHAEASEKAARAGKSAPTPPVTLTAEDMDFPKVVYGPDSQAKTVSTALELKALGAGWSETPALAAQAAVTPKKVEKVEK